ncbi:MAG: PKD domain-containing protein [Mongoliibacter sp.]|nr:MAG: PKD domain-containing protein [Mongoliibacter sp.]
MEMRKQYLPTIMLLFLGALAILFIEGAVAQDKGDKESQTEHQRTENVPSEGMSVNISGKLALCSHDDRGHILIDVNGGAAPYVFKWNNNETVQNRYNLLSGTYTVVITDNNGKEHTERIVIQPPFPLMAELIEKNDATCGSSADGSAKVEIKFGRGGPYTIEWSHGLRDELEATNLSPGSYTVTISDKFNCSTDVTFEIGEGTPGIEVNESIQDITCDNESGAIHLDVKGGSGNFNFEWSNGQTSKDITGLTAGIYEVLIQDAEGCSLLRTFEVVSSQSELLIEVSRVQHNLCAGAEDGEIDLEISGANAPFTIQWDNGKNSNRLTGLTAGSYTVKVSDATGCSVNQTVTIQEPEKLMAKLESSVEMDCSTGESKAYVWVKVDGGKSPYSINWSDGSKNLKEIEVTNVQEVTVEVIDADGCSIKERLRINSFDVQTGSRIDFNFRKLQINALDEVYTSESLVFESEISEDFIAWEWDFGDGLSSSDKDPIHVFNESGDYNVTLRAYDIYGCSSVETKAIKVLEYEEWVTIPSAFTPNGDGLNDSFEPLLKGVNDFKMNIFNNWGEQVYATSGLEFEGWDGTFKGKLLPRGSYIYQISYTTVQGKKIQETGSITLIR